MEPSNMITSSQMKLLDIRCNYINWYVEDCIVKIFFKLFDDDNDILTKNLSGKFYTKHMSK